MATSIVDPQLSDLEKAYLQRTLARFSELGYSLRFCRTIGKGGQALVVQCRLIEDNNIAGLKQGARLVIKAAHERCAACSFQNEYSILQKLETAGTALYKAYKLIPRNSQACGQPYQGDALLLDYVDGQSLRELVQVHGALSAQHTAIIMVQIAQQLCNLHIKGKVHLDVKPDNIIVSKDLKVVLIDFGVAQDLNSQASAVGTQRFIAPEHASSERGSPALPSSDMFSFGCTTLYMLTGGKTLSKKAIQNYAAQRRQYKQYVQQIASQIRAPTFLKELLTSMLEGDANVRVSLSCVIHQLNFMDKSCHQNVDMLNNGSSEESAAQPVTPPSPPKVTLRASPYSITPRAPPPDPPLVYETRAQMDAVIAPSSLGLPKIKTTAPQYSASSRQQSTLAMPSALGPFPDNENTRRIVTMRQFAEACAIHRTTKSLMRMYASTPSSSSSRASTPGPSLVDETRAQMDNGFAPSSCDLTNIGPAPPRLVTMKQFAEACAIPKSDKSLRKKDKGLWGIDLNSSTPSSSNDASFQSGSSTDSLTTESMIGSRSVGFGVPVYQPPTTSERGESLVQGKIVEKAKVRSLLSSHFGQSLGKAQNGSGGGVGGGSSGGKGECGSQEQFRGTSGSACEGAGTNAAGSQQSCDQHDGRLQPQKTTTTQHQQQQQLKLQSQSSVWEKGSSSGTTAPQVCSKVVGDVFSQRQLVQQKSQVTLGGVSDEFNSASCSYAHGARARGKAQVTTPGVSPLLLNRQSSQAKSGDGASSSSSSADDCVQSLLDMTLGSYNVTHAEEISSLLGGGSSAVFRGRKQMAVANYSDDTEILARLEDRMFALMRERHVEEVVQNIRGKPCEPSKSRWQFHASVKVYSPSRLGLPPTDECDEASAEQCIDGYSSPSGSSASSKRELITSSTQKGSVKSTPRRAEQKLAALCETCHADEGEPLTAPDLVQQAIMTDSYDVNDEGNVGLELDLEDLFSVGYFSGTELRKEQQFVVAQVASWKSRSLSSSLRRLFSA